MRTFIPASAPPAAKTLGAEYYVSADVFAREVQRIFSRYWIVAGREAQLSEPGDFLTVEIAGESLIVTRDQAGAINAFYNVCRHRGTRMCLENEGHFKGSIQCPYHAWTYGLDGSLVSARNMEGAPGFDRAEYPLKRAHAGVFEGFVFVALDPADTLEAYVSALHGRFGAWNIPSLGLGSRIDYELQCNWKLVFQNYSECYHCPVIHPQLERLSASDSGRNDLLEGPFLGGYSTLRSKDSSLTTSGHTTRPALPGVTGDELHRVYYYTIFPSLLLSLHPDYVMAHFVRPVAPGKTLVRCEWYFDPASASDCGDAVEFWDMTNRQDWQVNRLTQMGVGSRAYEPGPYSHQEGLLHAFDRHYLAALD